MLDLEDRWGIPIEILEEIKTSEGLTERIVFDNRIRISELDILAAKICHTLACIWRGEGPAPRYEEFLPHQPETAVDDGEAIFNMMAGFAKPGEKSAR